MVRPTDPRSPSPEASPGAAPLSSPSADNTLSTTRQMPQLLLEPSGGGQSALSPGGDGADDGVAPTQPTLARPRIVVMEEHPIGLADALAHRGYLVRAASTGIEAMAMCAEQSPVAVVVGPGDAERRRVLTAAVRLRFGTVLVVYALPPGDLVGRPEGVSAILPWPLPSASEVSRAIPFTTGAPAVTRVVPTPAARPSLSDNAMPMPADTLSAWGVPVSAPAAVASLAPVLTRPRAPDDGHGPSTLQMVRAELAAGTVEGGASDQTESGIGESDDDNDNDNGNGNDDDDGATAEYRGVWLDGALLAARLDEAVRFLDDLARRVPEAASHAETVRSAVQLMATLQERLRDVERG